MFGRGVQFASWKLYLRSFQKPTKKSVAYFKSWKLPHWSNTWIHLNSFSSYVCYIRPCFCFWALTLLVECPYQEIWTISQIVRTTIMCNGVCSNDLVALSFQYVEHIRRALTGRALIKTFRWRHSQFRQCFTGKMSLNCSFTKSNVCSLVCDAAY